MDNGRKRSINFNIAPTEALWFCKVVRNFDVLICIRNTVMLRSADNCFEFECVGSDLARNLGNPLNFPQLGRKTLGKAILVGEMGYLTRGK